MLLAKLGQPARQQFFAWTETVGAERFHVPLWSAHEFFKHKLKNTILTELSTDITRFDKATKQLYGSLVTYSSDQLFGFKDAGSMFLDEFKRTIQPIRAMLTLASKSKEAAVGVQEVAKYIDDLLVPGSLDELIDDIETDERVRNRGAIPPGFRDAHKRDGDKGKESTDVPAKADNSFGDIVFWREVLRHAKNVRAGAVIVITKDRKDDWFEKYNNDSVLTKDIRHRVSNPLPVPLAHPLLVREAHDFGAGALDLLDPMYCAVLLETAGSTFRDFASAVIDAHLPDPPTKQKAARSWATRFGSAARLLGAELGQDDDTDDDEEEFDVDILDAAMLRSTEALSPHAADLLPAITGDKPAARTLAFAELEPDTLSLWEVHDLVALGRVATELATNEVPEAAAFIDNLRNLGPEIPAALRLPLCFGAMGALYVDRELKPAPRSGARIVITVLDMSTAPEMVGAVARLAAVLNELGVANAIGLNGPIDVEVVSNPSADNKSNADLVAIKVDGTNLLTLIQDEEQLRLSTLVGRESAPFDVEVGTLLDIVSRFFLLPRQRIVADVELDSMVRVPEFAGVENED
jgi:hypothetical protein